MAMPGAAGLPLTEAVLRRYERLIRRTETTHSMVLEGFRSVREALEYADDSPVGLVVERSRLTSPDWKGIQAALKRHRETPVYVCTEPQMKRLSTVETPPGLLAIWSREPERSWPPRAEGYYAYFYQIRDPGNLGTIFRTALGAGLRGLLLSPGSVSPYNPKAARASMSACLRVPFWTDVRPEALIRWYQQDGMPLIVIHADKPHPLWEFRWPPRGVLVFGGETAPLPEVLSSLPGAHVPMLAPMDSLNVAVAATVAFYERLHARWHSRRDAP